MAVDAIMQSTGFLMVMPFSAENGISRLTAEKQRDASAERSNFPAAPVYVQTLHRFWFGSIPKKSVKQDALKIVRSVISNH